MPDDRNICGSPTDKSYSYCMALVSQCESKDTPIVLDTFDGTKISYNSPSACKSYSTFRAKTGVPSSFSAKPEQKKTEIKKAKPSPKNLQPSPAETKQKDFSECKTFDDKKANEYCQTAMAACSDDDNFVLMEGNTTHNFSNKSQCVMFAKIFSQNLMPSVEKPASTVEPKEKKSSEHTSSDTDERSLPKFTQTFSSAGFFPTTSSKIKREKHTLRFNFHGEKRSIKTEVVYRIVDSGTGTQIMKYNVYTGNAPREISEDELSNEIKFGVSGRTMDESLAFELVVDGNGDFEDYESIRIVTL